MQGHGHAMHTDVREASTRSQNRLADVEGGRYADRFNRHIDALTCGQIHHALNRTAVSAVDQCGGAKRFGHVQTPVVEVDHHDAGWRVELGRQQGGEPDRARADDRHSVAWLDVAIEYAALEA